MGWFGHLAVATALLLGVGVDARNIAEFPLEVRSRNMLQLSRTECDDCVTLEAFMTKNTLGFILIFQRNVGMAHRYKDAVVAGFYKTCEELRWSHVPCGLVDLLEDREYGTRFIDVKTAPAHIIVRDAQPVSLEKRHLDELMRKPGDVPTMLWHIGDALAPGSALDALHVSVEVSDKRAFSRHLDENEVVIVGAIDRAAATAFRAAAQRLALLGDIAALRGVRPRARQRQRVLFVALLSRDVREEHGLEAGAVVAFVGGRPRAEGRALLPAGARKKSMAVEKVLRSVALEAAAAAGSTRPGKPGTAAHPAAGGTQASDPAAAGAAQQADRTEKGTSPKKAKRARKRRHSEAHREL